MNTIVPLETLLNAVQQRTGLHASDEALACVRATLSVLGLTLYRADRTRLAHALPSELTAALLDVAEEGLTLDSEAFFARVGQQENVRAGFAAEHAQVVLQALAEHTSADLHAFLAARLSDDLMAWLRPRQAPRATPPKLRYDVRQTSRTLASGRPGALHALAEGRPDNAHANSVARSDDPHGDRKLSGARKAGGSSSPLAEAHVETERTIAEFKNA